MAREGQITDFEGTGGTTDSKKIDIFNARPSKAFSLILPSRSNKKKVRTTTPLLNLTTKPSPIGRTTSTCVGIHPLTSRNHKNDDPTFDNKADGLRNEKNSCERVPTTNNNMGENIMV